MTLNMYENVKKEHSYIPAAGRLETIFGVGKN